MPPLNELFEVIPFSLEVFISLLAKQTETPADAVQEKDHISYFEEYFEELQAATIVVEKHYIDHDFIDDYAAYYAKCFHPYGRFCSRLHFFTSHFTGEQFCNLLRGEEQLVTLESLNRSYLGFMVLKPLPETFIGRTCLATYPTDGRRHYPCTREYQAHLFGIPLSVSAVAFQEQDTAVAMCATSALWSVFQGTGKLFHHAILSPSKSRKLPH